MADTAVAARVLKAATVRTSPVLTLLGEDQGEEQRRQVEAALADAYQRGVMDGREAAERDGAAAVPRLVEAITAATAGAAAAAADQVRADTAALLELATEIAAWMVGEQAAMDATILTTRLATALDGLVPTAPLAIEVAPAQAETVRAWAGPAATVTTNPSLGPGDAVLSAGAAVADLRLDEAVRRALAAFRGAESDA